jgi:GDP-L-fucose synthase
MAKSIIIGSGGLVGSGLVRYHRTNDLEYIATCRADLDLLDACDVDEFFVEHVRPDDTVYLAAAIVGGIEANRSRPVEFIQDNLAIQHNVMSAAMRIGDHGPRRFVFLGSVCIYPKSVAINISETDVMTGPLEPCNQPYAMAKLAGLTACDAYHRQQGLSYVAPMPTNLYGPGDNYHPVWSHAVPGLLQRMHKTKVADEPQFVCWGTGTARRQFLYVDDLVAAIVGLASTDYVGHVNVAPGGTCSTFELAQEIKDVVGYNGEIVLDPSKPDGAPCRNMDTSLLRKLIPGWRESFSLKEGLEKTYLSYLLGEGRFIQEQSIA